MTNKTILTLVCTADRRSDECLVDIGSQKRLLHFDDWKQVCLQCEHCKLKLTNRGKEIERDFKCRTEYPSKQTESVVLRL